MQIKLYEKHMIFQEPFLTEMGVVKEGTNFFLQLTKGDITAYGEASPSPFKEGVLKYSSTPKKVKSDIKKLIKLIDFTNINLKFIKEFHKKFSDYCSESRAMMDMLFHDYLAKKENKQVWELYSSKKNKNSFLTKSVGTNDPEKIIQFIEENKKLLSIFKIKCTKENINNLPWDYLFKKNIIIDFNNSFNSSSEFLEFIKKIPKNTNFIFEEPFSIKNLNDEDIHLIKKLFLKTKFKLIFDDSFFNKKTYLDILNKKIVTGFNLKIQKLGGIYPCYELYSLNPNLNYMVGSVLESSLSICAGAQLGRIINSSSKNPLILDLDMDLFLGLSKNSPKCSRFERIPIEKKGLGYTPNLSLAKEIFKLEL